MTFEKGKPRHPKAGRRKGTPNKRTLLEQALEKAGMNPFDVLIDMALAGDSACVIHLCKSAEPVRKPVDVAIDPEANEIKVIIERYKK